MDLRKLLTPLQERYSLSLSLLSSLSLSLSLSDRCHYFCSRLYFISPNLIMLNFFYSIFSSTLLPYPRSHLYLFYISPHHVTMRQVYSAVETVICIPVRDYTRTGPGGFVTSVVRTQRTSLQPPPLTHTHIDKHPHMYTHT